MRHLATLNESRGRLACGFFNGVGGHYKDNDPATRFLRGEKLRAWLEESAATGLVAGHTRQPTRGTNIPANAHPFRYGEVVGSHNGCVDAPNEYNVDSMFLIDQLSKHKPGEYQKALKDVTGGFALTWLDERDQAFYLLSWGNVISFIHLTPGTYYYSSDSDHLETAVGYGGKHIGKIAWGDVWRFSNTKNGYKFKQLKDFKGTYRTVTYAATNARQNSSALNRYPMGALYDGEDYTTDYAREQVAQLSDLTGQVKRENGWWKASMTKGLDILLSMDTHRWLEARYPNAKHGETYRVPFSELFAKEREARSKWNTAPKEPEAKKDESLFAKKDEKLEDTKVMDAELKAVGDLSVQSEDGLAALVEGMTQAP